MRLRRARDAHDRRHGFARHHDGRRCQRDADAARHIEQSKEFRLLGDRQIAVAGTEPIRQIASARLDLRAHIALKIIADILDRRTRARVHDDGIRRIRDLIAHHQTLHAGTKRRTEQHDLLARREHRRYILPRKRDAEHGTVLERHLPISEARRRRLQNLVRAAAQLLCDVLRELLPAEAKILEYFVHI